MGYAVEPGPVDQLRIVHATAEIVVVDKPPGLLSVPGKGPDKADCVAARVRAAFPAACGPLIVHRLDMETSGLMVLGLTTGAQRELSRQFESRDVEKSYTALVRGSPGRDEGEISLPLRADVSHRPFQVVDRIHGRAAVTRYRVLVRETDRTRIWFLPVTGRTHQLRVHAAAAGGGLGCPIIGDVLYGDGRPGDRLMLHASGLSFRPPGGGARMGFTSPVPF
ncbi:MAG: RluA family pseudouridine synthase [Phycisphaerales bacterium]|nr:RluA family pseudouridine synthase [Phycisphaerales bacterium]